MTTRPGNDDASTDAAPPRGHLHWYWRGVRLALTLPALILATSFVGFSALAIQSGVTVGQATFMTAVIWALPAEVVLVGAIIAGTSLPVAAFAVALSSMRLSPMVVALVPELRGGRTREWVLYALSHFVAVTSWVIAMSNVRQVPRDMRTAWYFGIGSTLVLLNLCVIAAVYFFAASLPPLVAGALFLMMPLYFLTSLWGAARERATHVAMGLGLALGPVMHVLLPEFDLLATGLIGGLLAYFWHVRRGRAGR